MREKEKNHDIYVELGDKCGVDKCEDPSQKE